MAVVRKHTTSEENVIPEEMTTSMEKTEKKKSGGKSRWNGSQRSPLDGRPIVLAIQAKVFFEERKRVTHAIARSGAFVDIWFIAGSRRRRRQNVGGGVRTEIHQKFLKNSALH